MQVEGSLKPYYKATLRTGFPANLGIPFRKN